MTVISMTRTIRAGANWNPTWRIIVYEMAIKIRAKTAEHAMNGMTEPLRLTANVLSKPNIATNTEIQKPAIARRDRTASEGGEDVGVGAGACCIEDHLSFTA